MAIAKRKDVITAEQRMQADRIRRGKPPSSDPTGEHFAACRDIAEAAGVDVEQVHETWSERSALRQWDGGMTLADAEAAAIEDVRRIYGKQPTLPL